jgi:sec-independent protein translocase protein TatA
MFGIGIWEMLIILLIVLLFFGNRLAPAMRSLGRSVFEFKRGMQGVEDKRTDASSTEHGPRVITEQRVQE